MNQSVGVSQWECTKNNEVQTFTPPYDSLMKSIASYADAHPEKDAIVAVGDGKSGALNINYRVLAHVLMKSCSFFADELKLMPGDTISLLMVNKPELLVINWAAWSMGLKTVPLDSKRDTLERKLYKLQLTEASVLFVRTEQVDEWEIKQIREQMPSVRVVELDTEDRYFDFVRGAQQAGRDKILAESKK